MHISSFRRCYQLLNGWFHSPAHGRHSRWIASPCSKLHPERSFAAEREVLEEEKKTATIPVMIVGAGPVGLSLSILLSKYGIPSMLIDQRLKLSEHPQAHFINNRTMEIFRKMEGLESEIKSQQPPLEEWRKFVYCSTLSGPIFGTVDHFQSEGTTEWISPTSVAHFSQHRLLPLLFHRAQELSLSLNLANNIGCNDMMDSILFGHKLVALEANPDGVTTKISASAAGVIVPKEYKCRYLVATDGAGSSVRNLMSVGLDGEAELQNLISVHFLSKDLGQYLQLNQPGMLYFVFNSRVIAVIVAHNLEIGEFVAQIPYYPPQQVFNDFTEEFCRELICDISGMENLEIDVKAVKSWVMNAQVADTFICGHGRVILAGDAAHRFPPAGGFGMNTGIQDVHNLAWKLAAILDGHASPDLILTYEAERQPIAKANTALSVANFRAAMAIPVALGLNPAAARLAQKIVSGWLPKKLQGAILTGLFTVGRLQLSPVILNTFASSRVARVQQILKHRRSLQLQFPSQDLGFRYSCGAIYSEEHSPIFNSSRSTEQNQRQEHVPSSRPGARVPHCRILAMGCYNNISSKSTYSTLDLIKSDQVSFLLIVGSGRSGCHWADAALLISKNISMPIHIAVIWPKGSAERLSTSIQFPHNSALTEEENYVLFEWGYENRANVVHAEDFLNSWWEVCREALQGAILVRPDDHIAWRTPKPADNGAVSDLTRVLRFILKRNN